MFYLCEPLIRINTPHIDKSFDHKEDAHYKRQLERQVIEALNYYPSVVPFGGHTNTA